MPELFNESQVEDFMRQGFDAGASLDQMKSYLFDNGFVAAPTTPEVPTEPVVSEGRQRLEERVQAGVEAGGLRAVPAPGDEEAPPGPQVGFEKLEAAALGTVLPYLQVFDLQRKIPLLAASPIATIGTLGFSEGRRLVGAEPIAESPETRTVHDALRLAEEEVAPEGLLSVEGMQVLGLEILLDPMNALPGIGFADVPGKVMTATGRRLLGKGLLSADDFAKAFSSGLADDVWAESARMMESTQRAVVEKTLLSISTEAGQAAKTEAIKEGAAEILGSRIQKNAIDDAIQITKERYAQEISDTSSEYFEALDQLDIFQAERQSSLGFVEGDPRLAFDDVARVPSDLTQEAVPELTITSRDALRARLTESFPKAGKKRIQQMLDESTKIGTEMAEAAVEPGPSLPGRTPEGMRTRLREAFPDWADEQIEATVEAAISESNRVVQQSPQLEIPGRVGPPQTLYDTRDALLKGLERQLAETTLLERVHTDLFKKEYEALVSKLDTSPNSPLRQKISAKAEEIINRSGDSITEMARQAVERTYKVVIEKPVAPSRNEARLISRIGLKNFESLSKAINDATSPAELKKMGGLERLLWRAGYRFRGGESAEFIEGSLRAVAREYSDDGVKELLTQTWPRMYTAHKGRVAGRLFQAREAGGRVASEVRRVSKSGGMNLNEIGAQLNRARTSGDPTIIRDVGLREAFEDAGRMIDGMSDDFITEGLIPESEISKFRENMGKYLHMNYATFNLSNWKKNVRQTAVWDDAFQWFKRHYPEMSANEVTGNMMYLLSNRKKIVVGKGEQAFQNSLPGNLPKQVLDELKHRTHLPDELRELMGVNKDFLANFDITTATMIHDLEVTRFQRNILDSGLRSGVLRVTKDLTSPTRVIFDRVMGREVYADEALANALGVMDGMLKNKANFLGILNGVTKGLKIIPSPGTQMRNVMSIPFMWTANGTSGVWALNKIFNIARRATGKQLIEPKKTARLMRKLYSGVVLKKTGQYTKEEVALLERVHELGLTGTGVFTGETQIWAEQAKGLFQGSEIGRKIGALGKGGVVRGAGGALWDIMRRAYIATDDVGKTGSWLIWRDYLINTTIDQKSGLVTPRGQRYLMEAMGAETAPRNIRDVERVAAEYVKSTFQHYPRTAPIAKTLARAPVFGTFVSFPLEMARNVSNIFKFAGKHFAYGAKTGDQQALAIGGLLMTVPIVSAISWKGFKSIKDAEELEDNPEVEEAIRSYAVAPWAKNSDLVITKSETPGKWEVQDLGYSNPYGDLIEVFNAAIARPGTMEERMLRIAGTLEETLIGKELFLFSALEAMFNFQMENGLLSSVVTGDPEARQLVNRDMKGQGFERMYHFIKGAGPGGLVAADRIMNAATGARGFGLAPKKYQWTERELVDEVLGAVGVPRTVTVDPQKAFYFRFKGAMGDVESSKSAFKSSWRAAEGEVEQAIVMETYREQWDDLQIELQKMIRAAKTLGIADKRIAEFLSVVPTARVNAKVMRGLIGGVDVPFEAVYKLPRPIREN